ncbi:MAG: hypothetical protein J6Y89_08710 [Lachnospiraceae bacterium]|nr:hypothetical protein [Lachnospiraceae bacterium]
MKLIRFESQNGLTTGMAIADVTDEDANILDLCGYDHDGNEDDIEIWTLKKSA